MFRRWLLPRRSLAAVTGAGKVVGGGRDAVAWDVVFRCGLAELRGCNFEISVIALLRDQVPIAENVVAVVVGRVERSETRRFAGLL